ncbi:uncharacterized protein MELLADRAFT_113565 [Melampsora larici-populina 98AG31]|uniref:protein-histidine N-methyltransferase n=1 Tax=Melampsora larici-populina (strain 98AG31 / pathotype 3-4-7) TaxID=747676 RepID=F4SAB6_MELLP|nr:uncharacterized protein MELLADRAFT_113565 [Melampsora larici-populina 98AG31]EGF98431.1 hypothetical protein MELLADRAFT_113565 [Melampsora larici-populina 98AG31]
MFKFDFDLDSLTDTDKHEGSSSDQTNQNLNLNSSNKPIKTPTEPIPESSTDRSGEIKLEELITSLPPFLSYSSIKIKTIPTDSTKSIWKRDLYDAKYQTYLDPETQSDSSTEEEEEDQQKKKKRIDEKSNLNPKSNFKSNGLVGKSNDHVQNLLNDPSDLIPGVYEGGFKTWESSLDLIEYFSTHQTNLKFTNHLKPNQENQNQENQKELIKVLEIGCGTALPTVWFLFKLFYDLLLYEKSNTFDQRDQQDIPDHQPRIEFHFQDFNPEAFYRANQLVLSQTNPTSSTIEEDSGDLELTTDLHTHFLKTLHQHQIQLRFFYGPWHTFLRHPPSCSKLSIQYDLSYSSETIYSPDSVLSLVDLFKRIGSSDLLVACKSVYFGVGGSSYEFMRHCQDRGGKVCTVWSTDLLDRSEVLGVGRLIMKVDWSGVN